MSDLLDHLTSAQVHLTEAIRIQQHLEPAPVAVPPIQPAATRGIRKLATGLRHEYATMYPGSINHLAFLLQHPQGFVGLHYPDGQLYKMLPAAISHSSQPRWSRKKPTVFRYLWLNELREFDVANDQTTTIRKFKEFPNINGMGESDTSEDDDHIVLCSGQRVFVYEISSDTVLTEFNAPATFNNLYISSTNEPIVGFYDRGVQVYRQGKLVPLAARLGHMDSSSDAAGNPIIAWTNAADDSGLNKAAALPNCPNGVVKIDVLTGKQTCLLPLQWGQSVHISLPDRATFALVTTYVSKDPGSSLKYANEILKVALDGSGAQSLGRHGSDISKGQTENERYALQPKASVSPDGGRFIFDANGDVYIGVI